MRLKEIRLVILPRTVMNRKSDCIPVPLQQDHGELQSCRRITNGFGFLAKTKTAIS